jgi:type IV secretory pathway TraG/TraD family ATPase VirD4
LLRKDNLGALRHGISNWMRLAMLEIMNAAKGDQNIWFVVDELDALGAIDGPKDALARLQKFGDRRAWDLNHSPSLRHLRRAGSANDRRKLR